MKLLKVKITKGPIPFRGYIMNFFGTILTKSKVISSKTMNHEGIHECQAEDFGNKYFGYFIFYLLYGIEYLVKLMCKLFYWSIKPYRSVSFEQEAYLNDRIWQYQDCRKRFTWVKYIFKIYK